jgi:hypothetical protein
MSKPSGRKIVVALASVLASSVPFDVASAPAADGEHAFRTAPAAGPLVVDADLNGRPVGSAGFHKTYLAASGPWRAGISANAVFSEVQSLSAYPVGFSSWLVPDGVSVPLYWAVLADRSVRVLYHADAWSMLASGTVHAAGNPPDVELHIRAGASAVFPFSYHPYVSQSGREFRLPRQYAPIRRNADGTAPAVRTPAGLRSSGNADGHMVIFQPDGSAFEAFAAITLSEGTVVCASYQVTDSAGPGDGRQNGVTASMIPVYAGLVRKVELDAGLIDHAIKIVAPASLLAPEFVYPALAFDRAALTEDPPYSGTLPMGARLAIPKDVDLAGLKLRSQVGKVVAEAAQRHGFIITDRGGRGITLITEAGVGGSYPFDHGVEIDLRRIFSVVQRVDP